MVASWPKANKKLIDAESESRFETFKAVITAIRNTKAELNVPSEARPVVHLSSKRPDVRAFFDGQRPYVQALAQVKDVTVVEQVRKSGDAAATVVDLPAARGAAQAGGIEVVVPLAGLIDAGKERRRIETRVKELTDELGRLHAKLKDRQFVQRAPKDIVEQTKARRIQVAETLQKFASHLQILQTL